MAERLARVNRRDAFASDSDDDLSHGMTARGRQKRVKITYETEESDDMDELDPDDANVLVKAVPNFTEASTKSKDRASTLSQLEY